MTTHTSTVHKLKTTGLSLTHSSRDHEVVSSRASVVSRSRSLAHRVPSSSLRVENYVLPILHYVYFTYTQEYVLQSTSMFRIVFLKAA